MTIAVTIAVTAQVTADFAVTMAVTIAWDYTVPASVTVTVLSLSVSRETMEP